MQFESHLGHDVFPRQRFFCFDVCTKLDSRRSDGLGRGLWPGRRGACAGVWGGGVSALAGWHSALLSWSYMVPRSGFVGWARGGLHLFMGRWSGDDMMNRF